MMQQKANALKEAMVQANNPLADKKELQKANEGRKEVKRYQDLAREHKLLFDLDQESDNSSEGDLIDDTSGMITEKASKPGKVERIRIDQSNLNNLKD